MQLEASFPGRAGPQTSCSFGLQLQKRILQEFPIAQPCCRARSGVMAQITLGASPLALC